MGRRGAENRTGAESPSPRIPGRFERFNVSVSVGVGVTAFAQAVPPSLLEPIQRL